MRILRKSGRFLKMLQNEPLIAKFGVDTAEKCTIENLQILLNSAKFEVPAACWHALAPAQEAPAVQRAVQRAASCGASVPKPT